MTKPTIYTVAHPEDLSPPLANQGFCVDVVLASDYAAQAEELAAAGKTIEKLAAENVGLNDYINDDCWIWESGDEEYQDAKDYKPETPATDAALAEIRALGRIEGINFAASRLAAAFNHGFVEKPMAEVGDVVRMILTAKEDLANNPAEDGLSGEYAEKALAEWGAELRGEASKC